MIAELLVFLAGVALVLAWLVARRRHQELHDRAKAYERWEEWLDAEAADPDPFERRWRELVRWSRNA